MLNLKYIRLLSVLICLLVSHPSWGDILITPISGTLTDQALTDITDKSRSALRAQGVPVVENNHLKQIAPAPTTSGQWINLARSLEASVVVFTTINPKQTNNPVDKKHSEEPLSPPEFDVSIEITHLVKNITLQKSLTIKRTQLEDALASTIIGAIARISLIQKPLANSNKQSQTAKKQPSPAAPKLQVKIETTNVEANVSINGYPDNQYPSPHRFELPPNRYTFLVTQKNYNTAAINLSLVDKNAHVQVEMGRNRRLSGGIIMGIGGAMLLTSGIMAGISDTNTYDGYDGEANSSANTYRLAAEIVSVAALGTLIAGLVVILSSKKTTYKVTYQ